MNIKDMFTRCPTIIQHPIIYVLIYQVEPGEILVYVNILFMEYEAILTISI